MVDSGSSSPQRAKFFGKDDPGAFEKLRAMAVTANDKQMAQAAQYLESILEEKHAWFGGWALKLRGSNRNTEDLNIIVEAPTAAAVWDTLTKYDRITLYYYRHSLGGPGSHFKIFVDADDGHLVCVDVLMAGGLTSPRLDTAGAVDEIQAPPNISGGKKRVVSLRWQVRQKLAAAASRHKGTDLDDLKWLCEKYGAEIKTWIKEEDEEHRKKFYRYMMDYELDEAAISAVKECMMVEGMEAEEKSRGL